LANISIGKSCWTFPHPWHQWILSGGPNVWPCAFKLRGHWDGNSWARFRWQLFHSYVAPNRGSIKPL